MTIIVSQNDTPKKDKVVVPPGNYPAICYAVVFVGTVEKNFNGEKKLQKEIYISWEIPELMHVFREEDGEKPLAVFKTYTLSLHEKATLRGMLESWRGKALSEDELKGFDIQTIVSAPAMVNVTHNGDYVNVSSVTPLHKSIPIPNKINDPLLFDYNENFENLTKLPPWLQDKIKNTPEYKAKIEQEGTV